MAPYFKSRPRGQHGERLSPPSTLPFGRYGGHSVYGHERRNPHCPGIVLRHSDPTSRKFAYRDFSI